jgi:alginate O-acetyltransferase complex protein AlgI
MIFLPIVVGIYFLMSPKHRWAFLLAASYYFYMCWKMEYIVLIIASTLVDYYAGLQMGKSQDKSHRKKFLILSLISNLGILFAFKYFSFFNDSARAMFAQFDITYNAPLFQVLLPVGISFYTFQTLSYTIEVYRGNQKPEKHLGIFALYVAFFPQLVAGPIERSVNLLPQFFEKHKFEYERVRDGLILILWGLFKKVVIADRVAVVANTVFNAPEQANGVQVVIGTVFFAFQIYCDFSGYSDMAIGSAQLLGFRLMRNFDRPYFSKTIAEFWKRWHISLSSWFRDYLYISLGGNRVGIKRWYLNLLVTFTISGLWHGAAWTFVIWGALNGAYLILEVVTQRPKSWLLGVLKIESQSWLFKITSVAGTFALTCFAWIFFRANSLSDALYMINKLGSGWAELSSSLLSRNFAYTSGLLKGLGLSQVDFLIAVGSIFFLEVIHFVQRRGSGRALLRKQPTAVRWAFYYSLLAAILFLGAFNQSQQFIYFQF